MPTYQFFINDDRYTVPTLEFVQVRDAERARQLATDRLRLSSHHLSIEVRVGNEPLFSIVRTEAAKGADAAHRSAP